MKLKLFEVRFTGSGDLPFFYVDHDVAFLLARLDTDIALISSVVTVQDHVDVDIERKHEDLEELLTLRRANEQFNAANTALENTMVNLQAHNDHLLADLKVRDEQIKVLLTFRDAVLKGGAAAVQGLTDA